MLLCAVAWLPWVRGDSARMSSRDRSTLRKAMIGVGRANAPPSLRTGQALFTHPALQLMGSNSETEDFEF